MQITANRVVRVVASAAVLALPLAACAAVGGGGDELSDCESDVSGSEFTPVATAEYGVTGESCNNNEFVDTDLDAYAYPAADNDPDVFAFCNEDDATFRLFDVTSGVPSLVVSGDCDNQNHVSNDNSEGNRYVLVIEHGASSESTDFVVSTVD